MTSSHAPNFPIQNSPRVWLITSAACPIGIALARAVLTHGDSVLLGIEPSDMQKTDEQPTSRAVEFTKFIQEEVTPGAWKQRCKVVALDARYEADDTSRTFSTMGQCQAAVAEAIQSFGMVDILFCCAGQAVIGTVEELAASPRTLTLVRSQFETNFFGPVNIIKATLPAMRRHRSGHVIVLTGITSHLGTPGLGLYCASGWALEGFVDSLAYEIAPFNIRTTIVQPNLEISVLTQPISAAPLLPPYDPKSHPAPLSRSIISGIIDRLNPPPSPPVSADQAASHGLNGNSSTLPHSMQLTTPSSVATPPPIVARLSSTPSASQKSSSNSSSSSLPQDARSSRFNKPLTPLPAHPTTILPPAMIQQLIQETVYAICAIGGHENPPGRHIVGHEGVAAVKEKLKTVSEELEDFVEVSGAADLAMADASMATGPVFMAMS
ncbi:hypothetical protein MMC25_005700 [Agyrium rufum]|nr:hypothetical protein [Agyrium rufum]